jgi:glutamyl-tRNA synthetase
MEKVKVRFAPSPTGALHIGGIRTALYNYLFAKKNGGDFILRIEDTDTARTVPGAEQYIIDSLKWCGIIPNEGVGNLLYKQSVRHKTFNIYSEHLKKLVDDGNAYYAFDTPEEIEELKNTMEKSGVKTPFSYNSFTREKLKNSLTLSPEEVKERIDRNDPFVIRLKMPKGIEIKFKDIVRGDISVKSHNMDDKVLMKSDGMPTYHLANVVDDHLMEISHVIRGEEWLPSAPAHVYLYQCFGWELPEFAHLPNVLTPDGKKISKRFALDYNFPIFPINYTDPTSNIYKGFKEMGFLPDAFNNMLALLGWSPGGNVEVMSMEEMIDKFTLEKVGKSGAKFDFKKANWINHQHLLKMDNVQIGKMFLELQFNSDNSEFRNWALDGGDTDEKAKYVDKVCGLLKEKVSNLNDFWESGKYFFIEPNTISLVSDYVGDMEGFAGIITGWLDDKLLQGVIENNIVEHDDVKKAFDHAVDVSKIDARDAGRFLRFAITGMKVGPPIFDIIPLLGVEVSLKRIMKVLQLHAQNK